MTRTIESLTREELIHGLTYEWERLCHDVPEDGDATPEERQAELEKMTREELVFELDREEGEDLNTWVELYLI